MRLGIFFVLTVLLLSLASAQTLRSYVEDTADILSPQTENILESQLQALQDQTNGVQLVVFTEKAIPEDTSLEERTLQIAEDNGIGQKDADNGVLFYVAIDDPQYRWEVGYGVEDVLNSAKLGRLSREYIVPSFAQGDYDTGITNGVQVVSSLLANSGDEDVVRNELSPQRQPTSSGRNYGFFIWIAVFIFLSLIRRPRKRRGALEDAMYFAALGSLMGGNRGGGGFGGFGGGGFGGGGFSGKW